MKNCRKFNFIWKESPPRRLLSQASGNIQIFPHVVLLTKHIFMHSAGISEFSQFYQFVCKKNKVKDVTV